MTATASTRDGVLQAQHALTDAELQELLAAERRYEPDCDDDELQLRAHP
jgi:hypothetical protein